MAGSQIPIMGNQVEAQRLGYQATSLTNYDATTEPQLCAGSKVEIGGALFGFTALESITGWAGIAVNSDVYIKLTVSGASVTASFTITAPIWSTSKQGWYSGAERYIGGLRKDAGGNYTDKWLYTGGPEIRHEAIGDGQVREAKLAAYAVTESKLAAYAVTDAKINKTLGTTGLQVINAGGTWTPAAGVYVIVTEGGTTCYLEIFSGAWRRSNIPGWSGTIVTDGANVRMCSTTYAANVYWRKLS